MNFLLITVIGVLVWLLYLSRRPGQTKKFDLVDPSIIHQVEIEHLQIYKMVVQNSPDLFVVVDQGMQVMVVNNAAMMYGWKKSQPFFEVPLFPETSRMHFEFELKKVIKEGFAVNGEIRLARPDGTKFLMYSIFPIRSEHNEVVGATITAADITELRNTENELDRQREFAQGIIDAIPDALYVKDDHQKFLYGNKSFSEMVGRKLYDYVGLRDEEIFPQALAEDFKKNDRNVLRTNLPSEIEEEFYNSEKKRWIVLSKRVPFQFQNGQKVLIAIMRDFSERRKLENELQVSKGRQEEASRLATLGEIASGIAHEINNPLNVLVNVAELMKVKIEKEGTIEKTKLDDYSDKIIKYSMRIAKIVKGLRSISRDASQDPFTDVSLFALVDETLELCRQQYTILGIELVIKNVDTPVMVSGRFAQLSQILMNLLSNAKDAVEGLNSPSIHIEIAQDGSNGILRVWDSGPGISKEIENKIMNPFFTTKPVGKGTGLGLSISNSIARDHKGVLALNRNISASCFELQMPLLAIQNKKSA